MSCRFRKKEGSIEDDEDEGSGSGEREDVGGEVGSGLLLLGGASEELVGPSLDGASPSQLEVQEGSAGIGLVGPSLGGLSPVQLVVQ